MWQAESFDEAISLAEAEGREYCEVLPPAEYLASPDHSRAGAAARRASA